MEFRRQMFYRDVMRKAGGNIVTEVQNARKFINVKCRGQEVCTDEILRTGRFFRPIVADRENLIK